jgi:F-type H+-transporting ATPase subunit b
MKPLLELIFDAIDADTNAAAGAARLRPCMQIRALPAISTPFTSVRMNSSVPQEEPKKKAQSLLDALPGNSLVSKAAILSAGAGVSIAAISNEFYVVNEETIVAFSLLTIFWATAHYGGPMYNEWAASQQEKMKGILSSARQNHTASVKQRIESVGELSGVIDITKTLFEISKVPIHAKTASMDLDRERLALTQRPGNRPARGTSVRIGTEDCYRRRGQVRFGFLGTI